jgi:hypothetical protein
VLPEAVFSRYPPVAGEERPTGLLGPWSGEERQLPLAHKPQEASGCIVDEAHEVRADDEHFGERTQIGRSHAHAERMQGDGPELSRIPAVASHLRSAPQSRSPAITRELKHDLFGLCHGGTLCILVLLMDAGLVPVTELCVEFLVASKRGDIDGQIFGDRADARASFNCLPRGVLDGSVVEILEIPSLPIGKHRRCPMSQASQFHPLLPTS